MASAAVCVPLPRDVATCVDLSRFDERGQALLQHAYEFATFWHAAQLRKGTERPYVVHPVRVAAILERCDADPEVVAAGLLHDVIEDTPVLPREIAERFGARVGTLVVAVTRPKWGTWRLPADRDAALVKAADLASNLADTTLSLREIGPDVWKRFSLGRRKVIRWDDSLRQVERVLGPHPLVVECRSLLEGLAAAARSK